MSQGSQSVHTNLLGKEVELTHTGEQGSIAAVSTSEHGGVHHTVETAGGTLTQQPAENIRVKK